MELPIQITTLYLTTSFINKPQRIVNEVRKYVAW